MRGVRIQLAKRDRSATNPHPDPLPKREDDRYAELREFLARPASERMAFWRQELARCVKCYACRQVCPMCYCRRCIVDKNRPHGDQHLGNAQGQFRLADHAGLPSGRPLRRLRRMHPRVSGGHRPAAAEPVVGQGRRRELRLPRGRRSGRRADHRRLLRSKTRRTSSDERSPFSNRIGQAGRWLDRRGTARCRAAARP